MRKIDWKSNKIICEMGRYTSELTTVKTIGRLAYVTNVVAWARDRNVEKQCARMGNEMGHMRCN